MVAAASMNWNAAPVLTKFVTSVHMGLNKSVVACTRKARPVSSSRLNPKPCERIAAVVCGAGGWNKLVVTISLHGELDIVPAASVTVTE